ncbi:MAG: ion transporter [Bacteroidota bacterium]
MAELEPAEGARRRRLYEIVFQADDPVAKAFDIVLIVAIIASVAVVMLESVEAIETAVPRLLRVAEWFFTLLFTAEYALRLWIVKRKRAYALSFFGVVDFLSVIPTYLSLFLPGAQALLVVRILRVLRIFRVFKLAHYLAEAETLSRALVASRRKIAVFIFVVMTVVTVMGSLMYLVEGSANGFDSIPRGVYWAVVTLTTVGYGDISPSTPLGQAIALLIMIMGYGIIAVPTGIVTVELNRERKLEEQARRFSECPVCGLTQHDPDARFCKRCGECILREPPAVLLDRTEEAREDARLVEEAREDALGL